VHTVILCISLICCRIAVDGGNDFPPQENNEVKTRRVSLPRKRL
jgi:hypothetical protein